MAKSKYMGSPVHRKIDGKKYYALAWYPKKSDAMERAESLRKRSGMSGKRSGMSVRVIKGAPWGYPNSTAYMVYVPDHTRR